MSVQTVYNVLGFIIGIGVGMLIAGMLSSMMALPEPSCDDKQAQYDAYRLCMQTAGRSGCTMSVEDFAAYHQLKRELESCP